MRVGKGICETFTYREVVYIYVNFSFLFMNAFDIVCCGGVAVALAVLCLRCCKGSLSVVFWGRGGWGGLIRVGVLQLITAEMGPGGLGNEQPPQIYVRYIFHGVSASLFGCVANSQPKVNPAPAEAYV